MRTIKVAPNQSMSDLVIQGTGSENAGMQFCRDNDVAISDVPVVGTEYVISDAALALGDADVVAYFRKYGHMRNGVLEPMKIGTLGVGSYPPDVLMNDDGTPLLNDDGSYMYAD